MNISDNQPVLVTGSGGYIGRALVQALTRHRASQRTIVALDVRDEPEAQRRPGVTYLTCDIRSPDLADILIKHKIQHVVHLAAVVNPGPRADRALLHAIEVGGTENLLSACVRAGVRQVIVASSGAAYGYHADSPAWLDEDSPLRGNPEFAYSDHKRQIEERLARYRTDHPELRQLIVRPGTILGPVAKNQITDLFDKPYVLGLFGVRIPFVLIWDQDVVEVLHRGLQENREGIFNLAGDGVLTLEEMARMMGKPYVPVPVPLLAMGLRVGRRLGLTQYGPEQIGFLRYRPVLSNRRLKEVFGYTPKKTTRQVFDHFLSARALRCPGDHGV